MSDLISRGSYVEVWKGRMRKYPEKEEVIRIAIKRISDEATEKDRKFFLAEMEVLKMLKPHINVIQIIGCYTLNEPWLIMLEYAQDGTLFEYLQKGRPGDDLQEVEITSNARQSVKLKKKRLDSYRLLALAAQVANGLEHLNRFKLIYYRLRTLSVLMSKGGICKLSGFGFPQDIRERNLYESNSAPIRWMAPESIKDNTYNVKTDVWSYGITMNSSIS
ncbi:hypothetical protein KUTeg_006050 [Tegillarca granosa]|uniref:Protein kinase domain-containing protein n=1 Tax=Tegillarca granosa TaxID=220873 RepID=A0ABQ9FHA1_TEGGR|nr:hypothetical protein KUTeg_006050 [Tegillarca granosa]